jgi:2'-5' RNA ligase
MIPESTIPITDLNYIDYHYKQWKELTYEQQVYKANNVKVANNFSFSNKEWVALPYYGFGVISMLHQNEKNILLSQQLVDTQEKLMQLLQEKTSHEIHEKLFLLPENSFHQTIANALSNAKYDTHITEKGLATVYPEKINKILTTYQSVFENKTLRMKMIGLGIFGNAIGALGVFDDPFEYNSILHFRNHFYGNEISIEMGIQKTRPFIGHITLAYIEADLSLIEKKALVEVTTVLNEQWQNEKHFFYIDQAKLTSFDNLGRFNPFQNNQIIHF